MVLASAPYRRIRSVSMVFNREPVDLWFRNPHNYALEMVEAGVHQIAWDRGVLSKRRIDPKAFGLLYFPGLPWQAMCIGEQGAALIDAGHGLDNPKAVFPVWSYTEELSVLEDLLANPVGEDPECYMDMSLPPDERPVQGQEHRVIICDIPDQGKAPARAFMRKLKELQEDYPEAIVHVHGLYGYRPMFGLGFRACDADGRTEAAHGRIMLPTGKQMSPDKCGEYGQWISLFGMTPGELSVPRNRCIYNIKSAVWASQWYDVNIRFKTKGSHPIDYMTSHAKFTPPTTTKTNVMSNQGKAQPGDKIACDSCSLQTQCKYFRAGAVCSLPESEARDLAAAFKTRDADTILDGLGELVGRNVRRLENAHAEEEMEDGLDPHVTKLFHQVFDQAQKLAKLVDPKRFSPGAHVEVNVGGTTNQIAMMNPAQLMSYMVRELEAQGYRREEITPELINGALQAMADPSRAKQAITATAATIPGTVVSNE